MKYKVIILDFDGVIIESNDIKDQAFRALFSRFGPDYLDLIFSYHQQNQALIRFKKFKYIAEDILRIEYSKEVEDQWCQFFSDYVISHSCRCPYVNGAKDFLDYFSQEYDLYVVSINPSDDLQFIVHQRGLEKYFKAVYGVEEKTSTINTIIRDRSVVPSEVLFIGDSNSDYLAAQKTGIDFIGRNSGNVIANSDVKIFSNMELIKEYVCQLEK